MFPRVTLANHDFCGIVCASIRHLVRFGVVGESGTCQMFLLTLHLWRHCELYTNSRFWEECHDINSLLSENGWEINTGVSSQVRNWCVCVCCFVFFSRLHALRYSGLVGYNVTSWHRFIKTVSLGRLQK